MTLLRRIRPAWFLRNISARNAPRKDRLFARSSSMIFLAMKNIMSDEAISYLEKPDFDRYSYFEESAIFRL